MIDIDATLLASLVAPQAGPRGLRQSEIVGGMADTFSATLARYGLSTPLRIAHFLAQIAYESDGFCTTEEYATGQRYEMRADLGNLRAGDGPLYKGRGLLQVTGRANYGLMGAALGLDLVGYPLQVNAAPVYLLVSCVFWQQRGIDRFADADDLAGVTHCVNGGENGLDGRRAYLARAKTLLAGTLAEDAVPAGGGIGVLHRGSSGGAVTQLQKALAGLGYATALDGDFGPATELAVKHFQASAGLAPDGVVGQQTWSRIVQAGAAGLPQAA